MENLWILAQGDTSTTQERIGSQPSDSSSGTLVPADGDPTGPGPAEQPSLGVFQLILSVLLGILVEFMSPVKKELCVGLETGEEGVVCWAGEP